MDPVPATAIPQTIPAIKYKVKVVESQCDAFHGGGQYISEIFVPSHKVIVNFKGHIFPAEEPRTFEAKKFPSKVKEENPIENIQFPLELLDKIDSIAKLKLNIVPLEKEVQAHLSQFWKSNKPSKATDPIPAIELKSEAPATPPKTVPAKQYEVVIHESISDFMHGWGQKISEIFLPSINVVVNAKGGLFSSDKPRNVTAKTPFSEEVVKPMTDIEFPLELSVKIDAVAKIKLEISDQEKRIDGNLKALFKDDKPEFSPALNPPRVRVKPLKP